jgi:hypothetical protein
MMKHDDTDFDPLREFVRHNLDAAADVLTIHDDAQRAYDLFAEMSTDDLQLLLQAHRLDAQALRLPGSIVFSAGRQALIRAILKTREQPPVEQPDRDEGLRFSATVLKAAGGIFDHETDDRLDLLTWLADHAAPEAIVTITMTATGPAVPGMIAALRFGARRMR